MKGDLPNGCVSYKQFYTQDQMSNKWRIRIIKRRWPVPIYTICANSRASMSLCLTHTWYSFQVSASHQTVFWRNIPRGVKIGKCLGAIFYYFLVTSEGKTPNPREFHIHIIIDFFFIYFIQRLTQQMLICAWFVLGTMRMTASKMELSKNHLEQCGTPSNQPVPEVALVILFPGLKL